jgi:hypothetical protein
MAAPRKTTAKPRRAAATKSEASALLDRINATLYSETHIAECRAKLSQLQEDEFVLVMRKAREIGADPLKGDIYLKANASGYTAIATIACMRSFAQSQGDYAGDDQTMTIVSVSDPTYSIKVASGVSMIVVDPAKANPDTNPAGIVSCAMGVYRHVKGEFRRHSHTVAWDDYVPLFGGKIAGEAWANLPYVMIQKVAEVGALRKAYPQLGAVYIEEEMDQAGNRREVDEGRFSDAPKRPALQRAVAAVRDPQPRRRASAPAPEPTAVRGIEIPVNFLNARMTPVPADEYAKRVGEFLWKLLENKQWNKVVEWFGLNERARQEFYNHDARNGHKDAMRLKNYLDIAQGHIRKRTESRTGRRVGQRAAGQEARA